jgi:hypothetical protein
MTLPLLICLENYENNFDVYLDKVYLSFQQDFLYSYPMFKYDPSEIHINSRPYTNDKEFTFWHIISEGKAENERVPNLRRCERIKFPRYLIENYESIDCKIWEKDVLANKSREKRIHISTSDFSFLIVLSKLNKSNLKNKRTLITAFYVEREYQRKKYKSDHEKYRLI